MEVDGVVLVVVLSVEEVDVAGFVVVAGAVSTGGVGATSCSESQAANARTIARRVAALRIVTQGMGLACLS